jgi:hypothetical protein
MGKHMNRKELIDAAKKQTLPKSGHLAECQECRNAVKLLEAFPVFGALPLNDVPKAWIDRAVSIIKESGISDKIRIIKAKLVFDSWTKPQIVGVRGGNSICDRRLRFESDTISFDLRAEKREKIWTFMARASKKDIIEDTLILAVGRQRFQADKSGIFEWQASRPPKNITLHTKTISIGLPELSWKKQRSN